MVFETMSLRRYYIGSKFREREKPAWVLIRIILNLQIISGSIDIFMNIESSN